MLFLNKPTPQGSVVNCNYRGVAVDVNTIIGCVLIMRARVIEQTSSNWSAFIQWGQWKCHVGN